MKEMTTASKAPSDGITRPHRRLKILYLLDYLHGFGGTERHIYQLATSLDPERFSCTVCPMNYDDAVVALFADAGIEMIPFPFERIYDLHGLKQIRKLSGFIKERGFDILQTFNIASDIVGIIAGKLAGVPIIISSRRDMGEYRKAHHLFVTRFLNRYVTHCVAVCHAAAEQIVVRESIGWDRITTIYNGFDQSTLTAADPQSVAGIRDALGIHPEDFVIGYVAHFRPEKGHRILLEALRIVQPRIPRVKLLAVGAGATLPEIRQYAREQGLADHTIFTGYVSNVFDYVSLMDICCFTPISNEGFSNALLEQMSFAKAIVATDVGGNAEVIEHGVSGLIIPPANVDALAQAIQNLYYDPETRTAMGAKACQRVPDKFSMTQMLSQIEALYFRLFENLAESSNHRG